MYFICQLFYCMKKNRTSISYSLMKVGETFCNISVDWLTTLWIMDRFNMTEYRQWIIYPASSTCEINALKKITCFKIFVCWCSVPLFSYLKLRSMEFIARKLMGISLGIKPCLNKVVNFVATARFPSFMGCKDRYIIHLCSMIYHVLRQNFRLVRKKNHNTFFYTTLKHFNW